MALPALKYTDRNAKAVLPWSGSAVAPTFYSGSQPPQFTPLVTSMLGVLGTSKDGWDATIAPLAKAIPEHAVQTAAMDKNIAAATFTPGQIAKTQFAPVASAIAATTAVGDSYLNTYTSGLGGQPAPSGGGGGGTNGTGVGGGLGGGRTEGHGGGGQVGGGPLPIDDVLFSRPFLATQQRVKVPPLSTAWQWWRSTGKGKQP